MTYTINRYNDVGPDESTYLQIFGKYLAFISKPLIFNWSVTQYDTIIQQFNGGIRYIDLRLAIKKTDNEIYFLHGLYGDKVSQYFYEISNWLKNHPNEIIIMDFQHFYLFTKNNHHDLVQELKKIFGNKICQSTMDLNQITIERMNIKNCQVIIIYRNEIAKNDSDLWPSGLWPTPWPNTTNPNKLIDFLNTRLKTRLNNAGFISQCLLTPNKNYIFKHLCGSLHRDLARICRKTSDKWIEENYPGYGGLNVIITDYISNQNFLFSKIVIQRNAMLIVDKKKNNNVKKNLYLNDDKQFNYNEFPDF